MKDPCLYLSRASQKWGVSPAGQTSYGFANMCGSELCRARRAAGLPALAVGWGPIANVGVMAESDKVQATPIHHWTRDSAVRMQVQWQNSLLGASPAGLPMCPG